MSQKSLDRFTDWAVVWGPRLAGVALAMFVAWNFAAWLERRIYSHLEKIRFDATLSRFFASLSRYAVMIGAVLGCLGVFGIETASFAALIAAMGLAIGLAFQGSLSNFASGIMLLIFRPYKHGDAIEVAGESGTVECLELFSTVLKSADGRRIILPNSTIFSGKIVNNSYYPTKRFTVALQVEPRADIERTRRALNEALLRVAELEATPAAEVQLIDVLPTAVVWNVHAWVKSDELGALRQQTVQAAKQALEQAGIGAPRPQYGVHVEQSNGRTEAAFASVNRASS